MTNQRMNSKKKTYGLILIISFVWAIYYTYNFELELSELKEVNGVLLKNPKFNSNRSGKSIELVIYEDNWRYLTSGIGYQVLDADGVKRDFKIGQSITLLVSESSGVNEFLDRIVGVVDFYGLKSNGKTYLKLEDYNKQLYNNRCIGIFVWFILFVYYIYSFWLPDIIHFIKENKPSP